ncbi:GntR family transcriptional regulator [Streptomyces sp. NPDC059477]|uniref:GntR family transcriptional regulator n=1 Tax=Streptomyces sp. NPDC059477 TaxID=3346847 RepID=UPI0036A25F97
MPTLPELCREYGDVSQMTIRNALALLRNEGLIETRARAGTRVRPRPPVHRMAADRYRATPGAPSTPYTRDQGIGWSEYRLDKRFEKVQADAELAALFECEIGDRPLARHFVFHDNDQPTHDVDVLRTLVRCRWYSGRRPDQRSVAGRHSGTAGHARDPGCGSHGVVHRGDADRDGGGVPVLRYTRKHIADTGRIVEVAHPIVRRGDTTVVDFRIEPDD